jgi:hypothetical protein
MTPSDSLALAAPPASGSRPREIEHAAVQRAARTLLCAVGADVESGRCGTPRADLMRWFNFGAYASAGVDRPGIVRRAVERGEAMLGRDVANTEIYVIGDTPLGIEAAHAVGCTAIAVATGHYDAAALRDVGAEDVLDTLEQELPLT